MKPNILISPLDWGLGHATRCIPLIRALLRQNCQVFVATDGKTKRLLQKEFPQLIFPPLRGYGVSYSKNRWTLPLVIATQIPKILSAIKYENQRLAEIVEEHHIDGIISDNRYGLYHPRVPSVFITHQLRIRSHLGKTADDYLQKLNYRYIGRFSECWVPDYENEPNLGGELSHPEKKPGIPLKYLGPLSRFSKSQEASEKHLLILLSGPEPQRTLMENLLASQLGDYHGAVVFVRGLPENTLPLNIPSHVELHDHLTADELNKKILEASLVISRAGYSTVMDLAALQKKSILIPTPGQTEQEYLALHLMKMNFALSIEQNKFKLINAIALAGQFNYQLQRFNPETHLDAAVKSFLYKIEFKVFG